METPRAVLACAGAQGTLQLTSKPVASPHHQPSVWEGSSIQYLLQGEHSSVMELSRAVSALPKATELSRTGSALPKVCAQD